MTVYILPCGVSILDGLSLGRGLPGGAADPTDLCAKAVPWAERARYSDDAMVVTRYQEDLDAVIDEARLGNWAAEVAAETNSLGSRTSLSKVLTDGHTVVLLASDTNPGVAAAMAVAARIAANPDGTISYGQIRYVSTPELRVLEPGSHAGWPYEFVTGSVTVVRVRELNPRIPSGLDIAAAGLGQALRAAYDSAHGMGVEIHLTGGLKATLLHTLLMVEVLHSLSADVEMSAWYLYDDDITASPEAIRIGLRRFESTYLSEMREELCNVRDRNATSGRTFEGLAWRGKGAEARLTDFGTAFLAVLGEEIRPPGDDEGYRR